MKKNKRLVPIAILLGATTLFVFWLLPDERGLYPSPLADLIGQVFSDRVTTESLAARYAQNELSILIVPGHDNEYAGAEFAGIREADLNLELSQWLEKFLAEDGAFRVWGTRQAANGDYQPEFTRYFTEKRSEIEEFRLKLRQNFQDLLATGRVVEKQAMNHNFAKPEVSLRLYGINKWANENNIDFTLHIHFNDYAGRSWRQAGRYSGLAIYVPESQYPNARASRALGESLFRRLTQTVAPSNLPLEMAGVIDDQELIAIGAQASRDGAAALIEYGYIYESPLHNPATRSAYLEELAWQTYLGLKEHFDPTTAMTLDTTRLLPHRFSATSLVEGVRGSRDVLALQKALALEKLYPPPGNNLNNCPINGNFGPCVRQAVNLFQGKYAADILIPGAIFSPTGVAGPLTLGVVNRLYGG